MLPLLLNYLPLLDLHLLIYRGLSWLHLVSVVHPIRNRDCLIVSKLYCLYVLLSDPLDHAFVDGLSEISIGLVSLRSKLVLTDEVACNLLRGYIALLCSSKRAMHVSLSVYSS